MLLRSSRLKTSEKAFNLMVSGTCLCLLEKKRHQALASGWQSSVFSLNCHDGIIRP